VAVDEVEKYYEQQILWFQICPPNHTEFGGKNIWAK